MTLALEVKQALNKMSPVTNTQQLVVTVFSSGETLALLKVYRLTLIIQEEDYKSASTVGLASYFDGMIEIIVWELEILNISLLSPDIIFLAVCSSSPFFGDQMFKPHSEIGYSH